MSIADRNRITALEDRLDAMAPQLEEIERMLAELQDGLAALARGQRTRKKPKRGTANGTSRSTAAG